MWRLANNSRKNSNLHVLNGWRASGVLSFWLATSFPIHAVESPIYSLRWNTNSTQAVVELSGLAKPLLRQLQTNGWQSAEWQKLFPVYAAQGDFIVDMTVPPMLGNYRVENDLIRFYPQFALQRGVTYRAVFRPSKLAISQKAEDVISKFALADAAREGTTIVTQVYPGADVLPENLLKFYVHFSAPMQGGHIYDYIHLRHESGKPVELPFLEIDEELWNPEMTRLTLFIDPGRIKRGVQPLEEIGPALEEGKRYVLEIDAAWRDSAGSPLRETYRKTFRVGAQDREPPTLASWKIESPKAGTCEPLIVIFAEPMDQALALRVISIVDGAGKLVEVTNALSGHETRLNLTPRQSWSAGRYQLQVQNTIEDLAGNNIGKAFEVDLFEGVQRRFTNTVVKLSFDVR